VEKVHLSTWVPASWKSALPLLRSQEAFLVRDESGCESVAVIKLGGSIFTGPISYGRAARYIGQRLAANPEENLVVVVSAQNGATDALLREAQAIVSEPNDAALDLLWSTGELRSVARLALHLQAVGIPAAALDVRQTGLRIAARGLGVAKARFEATNIRKALGAQRVVIVPGFLATDDAGDIVTLGRGGSDLTAVLLARGLGASRCELIKDVPGYFTDDPNLSASARHLPSLSFAQALVMADGGCDLVQRAALEVAEQSDLPIVVRSLEENAAESWVTTPAVVGRGTFRKAQIEDVDEADLSSISTGN
jgi:aspartate kinase